MAKKHGPNQQNLDATRRLFIDVARKEFSRVGYHDASTAAIVEESGMARGSLYYHFGDKKGLFHAVYEELMEQMQEAVRKRAQGDDAWSDLMDSCSTVLDLCTKRETRRLIVDVHTALTYNERLEILNRTVLGELSRIVERTMQAGLFEGHRLQGLTLLIFGMLSECGRNLELASDVAQARKDVGESFALFMSRASGR